MKIKINGVDSINTKSNNTSFLIDEHILFDVGAGIVHKLAEIGYDITKLKCVIVSHYHSDHFADLINLLILASMVKV